MELTQADFIPTLNEYVDFNIRSSDPVIKTMVDDFCDFPGSDDIQSEIERNKSKKRFSLLNGFNKRIDDIIMLNRYALYQYNINAEKISPLLKDYDEQHNGIFSRIYNEHDEEEINSARSAFRNFNIACEVLSARKIADEGLIIHLWATIEQFVKRAVIIKDEGIENMPFKWNALKKLSKDIGVDLEQIPSYSIIDEVRVVNNKIKHLYVVDNELGKYPGFEKHVGKKMSIIDYKTHDYALATYHFMNRLIMAMGPFISYAPDR
ncbi:MULTISPECIES: hypothetical protein [Kosakonia]|uniref:Uncharacterized protein n=1 Tax=Kosakonia oryzae TaxID=497725 RepID=A0AA94H5C3_9ENTR|nr:MULTISPECIES: hypothetical protein [Kosakonia]ANI82429.1 hypothetical protein AWR26_09795 [Kosakonia oryzae]SFC57806.1 hypothetical protein SAMN05216286_2773 [Kosakonia oryzae]VVT52149.1 hypothetical protein UYSO10_3894 [Kosakonia radicincitans]